jgi:hypothetical protein
VDVEVWTMGGVVLLGLVISMLSKVVTWHKQYLCGSNVYYDRMRRIVASVAIILPFFPFWDSFFSLSLSNTQWNDRKTRF